MGRFYDIALFNAPTAGATNQPPFRRWTSTPNGVFDPNALQVEFDFFSYLNAGSGTDGSTVTVHGIPLTDILQVQQFSGDQPGQGMQVIVKGGMSGGLPLESPTQAGLILSGQIYQSFGNWVGTEMNLNFVVYASKYTFTRPGNFVIQWRANTSLADALKQTLAVAYPNLGVIVKIANTYVRNHDVTAKYSTLSQLGQWVRKATATSTTPGVTISTPVNDTVLVTDGSIAGNATQLKFTDLIGQPTWNQPNVMQFTTVMRADIQIGGTVKMPQGLQDAPGIVQTTASSTPSYLKYKTAFQGNFLITSVRQVANFRDTNAASWATVFECVPQGAIGA